MEAEVATQKEIALRERISRIATDWSDCLSRMRMLETLMADALNELAKTRTAVPGIRTADE